MPLLTRNRYGKTDVRVMHVDRSGHPHRVSELSIDIIFEGAFEAAYESGDNSGVLPTDTMKNTAYLLTRQLPWDSIENLSLGLSDHFLSRLPALQTIQIEIEQVPWTAIPGHASAFLHGGPERRTARLQATRQSQTIYSGLKGLQILKTSNSAFAGFQRDDLTTLPETGDRLFGTILEAQWRTEPIDHSPNQTFASVRGALLDCFAQHHSRSVQHTMFAMGEAALEQNAALAEIHLVMPNKHCLLIDLTRFGSDNPNLVFQPIDEPSGYIEAHLRR